MRSMMLAGAMGLWTAILASGCAAAMDVKSAEPPPPPRDARVAATAAPTGSPVKNVTAKDAPPKQISPDGLNEQVGDSFGEGGLGMTGTGPGGGGTGEGIGLGSVGTIGHGAGTGEGRGFGAGAGGGASGGKGKVQGATALASGDGLPPEVIQRIVRANMSRVKFCYEKALTKDATLSGKVAVKFTIDPHGAVTQAASADANIADADMVSCVVGVVRSLTFPSPDGGPMVVTYPFHFSSAD